VGREEQSDGGDERGDPADNVLHGHTPDFLTAAPVNRQTSAG
jgi:hypothetical protein